MSFFHFLKKKFKKNNTLNASITVIIPAYNAVNTIQKTLKSIQNQSHQNIEIIVIDDASNDETLNVLKTFDESNKRIKIFINNKNMGAAYSKNVGLSHATSDYITFHDADDISHPERFERQLFELLTNKKKIISICKYQRTDLEGNGYIVNGKKVMNYVSGMMFKKDLIDRIGYFKPTRVSEDSEYHERVLAVYGKRGRSIINRVLYYALFSPDSLLFSNANVQVIDNKINYKITDKEVLSLDQYRIDHKAIKKGQISPYQSFEVDDQITRLYQK